MGFLDALLGRSKPSQANLDHLFGLPSARITIEAAESLSPTGSAAVCFKPTVGQEFHATETEFADLLRLGGDENTAPPAKLVDDVDEYGYQWVVVNSDDFDTLVTRVHLVNSTLEEHGYGPQLLCSVFAFANSGSQLTIATTSKPASTYLVYLYKRGTFYPFVPLTGEKRDNETELRIKEELSQDLSIEPDLDRWFPIWKLPLH